jgi:hypothetical protein
MPEGAGEENNNKKKVCCSVKFSQLHKAAVLHRLARKTMVTS